MTSRAPSSGRSAVPWEVAHHVGGSTGALLAGASRGAFMSGMDLAVLAGAIVVLAGAALALAILPRRTPRHTQSHAAGARKPKNVAGSPTS